MPEQNLNGPDVGARLQKVGSKRVTQGLLILLMICRQQRSAIGVIPSVA